MFTCDVCKEQIKRGAPFAEIDISYKQTMVRKTFDTHLYLCEDCYAQLMDWIDDLEDDV